jgi:hypothetical protein
MNTNYENKLLNHFIPILYLHSKEKISPISIEEYIKNCELCINGTKTRVKKNILSEPKIVRKNKEILINKGNINLPLTNFYNNIPNKYLDYCGDYPIPNEYTINDIPIYGIVYEYKNYIDIIYIFNYYYNESYKFLFLYLGGGHQADIEHIRIRIDNKNLYNPNIPLKVLSIFFSAHSIDQGRWIKPNKIDWYNNEINGQPIVYVAKGSHANYNKPGTWYRFFGFANDKTVKNNSIIWKPKRVINLKLEDTLMSYRGDMGNNGVNDLNRQWINAPDENINSSFLYRFFYPLVNLSCISHH